MEVQEDFKIFFCEIEDKWRFRSFYTKQENFMKFGKLNFGRFDVAISLCIVKLEWLENLIMFPVKIRE